VAYPEQKYRHPPDLDIEVDLSIHQSLVSPLEEPIFNWTEVVLEISKICLSNT
jgi:hypothetical protein